MKPQIFWKIVVLVMLTIFLIGCGAQNDVSDGASSEIRDEETPTVSMSVFSKQYGIADFNSSNAVAWSSDGNILTAFASFNGNPIYDIDRMDASVMKIDGVGNILWQQSMGGPNQDNFRFILPDDSGGCLLVGRYDEDRPGVQYAQVTAWLVKMDAYGNVEWEKRIAREGSLQIFAAMPYEGSQIILAGSRSTSTGDKTSTLMILDENADILFERDYQPFATVNKFKSINLIENNHLLLTGTIGELGDFHGFARLVDNQGNTIWFKEYQDLRSIDASIILPDNTVYYFTQCMNPYRVLISHANEEGELLEQDFVIDGASSVSNLCYSGNEIYFCVKNSIQQGGELAYFLYTISNDGPENLGAIDVAGVVGSTSECALAADQDGNWLAVFGHSFTESGQNTIVWLSTIEL